MANKPYYGTYKTNLELDSGKEISNVSSSGSFKEFSSKEIVVDNQDDFVKIFELDTTTSGSLDYISSEINSLLIENIGNTAIELQFKIGGMDAAAPDTWDAYKYINTLVPSNDFHYIGMPKIIEYGANTSAANGATLSGTSQTNTPIANSGAALAASMTATASDTQITLGSNETNYFRVGDILALSPFANAGFATGASTHNTEWIEVLSIDSATQMTVRRALYGQGAYAHDHTDSNEKILWFWHANLNINPVVLVDNTVSLTAASSNTQPTMVKTGTKWKALGFQEGMMIFTAGQVGSELGVITHFSSDGLTAHIHELSLVWEAASASSDYSYIKGFWPGTDKDGNGLFQQGLKTGVARHANGSEQGAYVPGSLAIQFPSPAFAKLGLSNINSRTNTGLTASTSYCFDLHIDGQIVKISFTTDASNLSYGGSNGIVSKIQRAIDDKIREGDIRTNCTVSIENGDIVFKSHIGGGQYGGYFGNTPTASPFDGRTGMSNVDIVDAGTVGSDTQFLGSGNIPNKTQWGSGNLYPSDTSTHPITGATIKESSSYLIDKGDTSLEREEGGTAVINYNTQKLELSNCPPFSDLKFTVTSSSALGGGYVDSNTSWSNGIVAVYARSVNSKSDSIIKVTTLG